MGNDATNVICDNLLVIYGYMVINCRMWRKKQGAGHKAQGVRGEA
jgi:hypothetical protein